MKKSLRAATSSNPYAAKLNEIISNKDKVSDSKRLHQIFELDWKYLIREFPEFATYLGLPDGADRWTDQSLSAKAQRKANHKSLLRAVESIRESKLNPEDRLNYQLFKYDTEDLVKADQFKGDTLVIAQKSGFQIDTLEVIRLMPKQTVQDFENILSRLSKIPELVAEVRILLETGLKEKITPPQVTMQGLTEQLNTLSNAEAKDSPWLEAFQNRPHDIIEAQWKNLQERARKILRDQIAPSVRKIAEFIEKDYIPQCRKSIAWSDLPDGKNWYAYFVEHHTTTHLSPQEIHDIGLSEVKRIRSEMDKLMASVKFRGNLREFTKYLLSDSKFFFKKPEDLIHSYRDIAKRIDPELPRIIGKLPRLTYGIRPVPANIAKTQVAAYYQPGSVVAGRAGYFYANTYDLKSRPTWQMEALTLHESVPGHHLQIALAQEMENVPEFRKNSGYTAYIEGWGLYSESLGKMLGMYEDPYSDFGRLAFEIWRACRLVVDTGMHALGWSRDRAIEFLRENSAESDHDIVVEVDRYIETPGQALAYKIGELKIKELRERAKNELGEKFDIRKFHDAVLENGALPLTVLESKIDDWIQSQRPAKARSKRTTAP